MVSGEGRKSESPLCQQLGPAALSKPGDSGHGQASRLGEYFLEEKWKEFKNKPKTCFSLSCPLLKARLWQTDRQKLASFTVKEDSPQSQVVLYKFWILTLIRYLVCKYFFSSLLLLISFAVQFLSSKYSYLCSLAFGVCVLFFLFRTFNCHML